jgi:serine/tyrosine/threonine adenylyltransferase
MTYHFPFEHTYASLPDRFYARVPPAPVSAPKLIRLNRDLASALRLDPDWLGSREGVEVLAGKRVPPQATPIAQAYAGHQFGQFVPQLGDGRAILLGEVVDVQGVRRDIQLKGSGPTPFSRRGDGRAALGPVLREYVVSEAMAALGIPTTRSLAAVTTGELVARDRLLPGAVLVRVASSHIRVGTFQFFAARGDQEGVRLLADHVIVRHYPHVGSATGPYRALLDEIVARQADLIAAWLLVGFVHGVMNTDNTSIAGETIDYGPCAFMDSYNPGTVFSSIDHQGRYAYGNQPRIALWNLARLAETLLPLLSEAEEKAIAEAEEALAAFAPRFEAALHNGFRRKLGILTSRDGDVELVQDLLNLMAENQADLTLTFRRLSAAAEERESDELVRQLFPSSLGFEKWMERWRKRLAEEPQDVAVRSAAMRAVNPAYIPRNHRVEAMIEAAIEREDFRPFNELLEVLATPFVDQARYAQYAQPPEPHERVHQTFCGT